MKFGELYVIRPMNGALIEAYLVGAFKSLKRGEAFYVFETPDGLIYHKPASEFNPQPKPGPVLTVSKC